MELVSSPATATDERRLVAADEGGGRFTSGVVEPLPNISTSDSNILLLKKRARGRLYIIKREVYVGREGS